MLRTAGIFVCAMILCSSVKTVLAQEEIKITTYYPSPAGAYNQLQTNRIAVGDTNADGTINSADMPPEAGQLYIARSAIFRPQPDLHAIQLLLNPREGEVAYARAEDEFYYYNGSKWAGLGGGSGGDSYISWASVSCHADYEVAYSGVAIAIMNLSSTSIGSVVCGPRPPATYQTVPSAGSTLATKPYGVAVESGCVGCYIHCAVCVKK